MKRNKINQIVIRPYFLAFSHDLDIKSHGPRSPNCPLKGRFSSGFEGASAIK